MKVRPFEFTCYKLASEGKLAMSDAKYLIDKMVRAFTGDQINKVIKEYKSLIRVPDGERYLEL